LLLLLYFSLILFVYHLCRTVVCSQLPSVGRKEGVVIQPGLFKGTYGGHGNELMLLTYPEDDRNQAIVFKVTVSVINVLVIFINNHLGLTVHFSSLGVLVHNNNNKYETQWFCLPVASFCHIQYATTQIS